MTQTTSLTHTQSDRSAQKRRVLAALDALRLEARRQNPDLSAEAAYRLAGFSEKSSKTLCARIRNWLLQRYKVTPLFGYGFSPSKSAVLSHTSSITSA